MRKITKQLLKKSTESFLLSLELINKPTIGYRTESFAILHTNAWELLLKARIFEINKGRKLSIFRRKKPRQRRESISLDESIVRIFQNENDPIKRNIEYISEIRNAATHLTIADLDPLFLRAFQSGVFNYLSLLYQWFDVDLENIIKPGLLSLITDEKVPKLNTLRSKYNKEDYKLVSDLIGEFNNLVKLGLGGAISVEYSVAIVKNPKKADFVISSGPKGIKTALILEKPRDVDFSHPFNMTKALTEIKKRLTSSTKFTAYDFQAYCFVKGIKRTNKNDYFWRSKFSPAGQYSKKFVDELVEAVYANPKNLKKWRSQYKQYLQSRRRKKKFNPIIL